MVPGSTPHKFTFVAFLYLMAGAGLLLGGGALYHRLQFDFGSQTGTMLSTDPGIARAAKFAPGTTVRANVTYTTASGVVTVRDKFVGADDVQILARGEGVPVRFLTSDPLRVLPPNEELPYGFGFFALGFGALAVGVYAHRLLRREMLAE